MKQITINEKTIKKYKDHLTNEERSKATIEKYIRDIEKFYTSLPENKLINKENVLRYKQSLEEDYKATSINSMLVAINGFLEYLDLAKLKVKLHRLQKRVFADQSKELNKEEYKRLVNAAKQRDNDRLSMLIQTICATGIRVSEHKAITVEAIKLQKAMINNKGKVREIYLDSKLCKQLKAYCKRNHIKSGCIFITKKGKPLDRSNIWKMMKKLCKEANVDSAKVFPHNLRHLFAFTYYHIEKDIDRLASILGHSSIETTRIYTMSNGKDCIKGIKNVSRLVLLLE